MLEILRRITQLKRIVPLALIISVYFLVNPLGVYASIYNDGNKKLNVSGCTSGEYYNIDANNRSDLLTINCSFFSSHDTISIYPYNHTFDITSPWETNIDQKESIWIFDAGSRNKAILIIHFHQDGTAVIADLYQDLDGDQQVSYQFQNNLPTVTEKDPQTDKTFWSLRVTAPDGWWIKNDIVNFNLTLQVDGPMRATFGPDLTQDKMKIDGNPDISIHIVDKDHNGSPDYDLRRLLMPLPSRDGYYRLNLMVNEVPNDYPLQYSILWPYLGSTYGGVLGYSPGGTQVFKDRNNRGYGVVRDYRENPAPIQVDWNKGKIEYIGEFVPSRGSEDNWFVYSLIDTPPGKITESDFETPFAFYDLANDNDGLPELAIRNEYFSPNDIFYNEVGADSGYSTVRYSWDQTNDQSWDYKVSMVGKTSPITDTQYFDDIGIRVLPYKELPKRVLDRNKDAPAAVTFVSHESAERYWTTEGIYEWDSASALPEYLTGLSGAEPLHGFNVIKPGLRGEYYLRSDTQLRLYMSSIDHKLHLLHAHEGIWQIDTAASMSYTDSGDGKYIDQMTYTQVITEPQTYTITRQLSIAPSHLLYGDGKDVFVRQAQIQPSLFETLPPTNNAEWQTLGQQLELNKREFAPGDLRAMMEQFAGPEMRISGAEISDYRPVGTDGFRFVLNLAANFSVEGTDLLGLRGLAPDAYAVSYDGNFHVAPLTAPAISAEIRNSAFTQWQPGMLRVKLHNSGLADVGNATVELLAARGTGQPTEVATRTVTLLSGVSDELTLPWTPNSPGDWSLTMRIHHPDWDNLLSQQLVVAVTPATVSTEQIVLANDSPLFASLAGLVLIGICVLGGAIFWLQLGWTRRKQVSSDR